MLTPTGLIISSMLLVACTAVDTEQVALDQPALEGPRANAEHRLVLGAAASAELTSDTPAHYFELELPLEADVTFTTAPAAPGGREVDTLLALYGLSERAPRLLARNDDYAHTRWSQLSQRLDSGRYRVVVQGAGRRGRGAFSLLSTCAGPGCPPVDPPSPADACLFGSVFSDIRANPLLELTSETWIRSAAELDALEADQVVRAVQQSSHTDVSTAAEALARVDQQEIRRIELATRDSGREFRVLEYGVGDNWYGAFFESDSTLVVASIHDGDLLDCSVHAVTGDSSEP